MQTPGEAEPPTVHADRRSLMVLAGLPGAGKSTLLDNVQGAEEVLVLDSEQVRRRLRASLPDRTPYCWYRPVVHMTHRARIGWYCVASTQPIMAHEPSTRATTRAMLVLFGWVARRQRVLVWLDAAPAEALAGQRARGRLIPARSFRRHIRRAARVRRVLYSEGSPRGWNSVFLIRRGESENGIRVRMHG